MSGGQWDRTVPPNEEEFVRAWVEHALMDVHTARPARVQSYDATTQTADLVPLVRNAVELPDGTIAHEDLPVLPSVPVLWPRTADHFIAFALAPGDMVLVVFCDAAIGHWRAATDGGVTDPGDLRRHSLSHGVAIPGLFHRGAKLSHAPGYSGSTPRMVVGSDVDGGPRVSIYPDGRLDVTIGNNVLLRVAGDGSTVTLGGTAAQFVALANLVDARLAAIRTWLNAHQHVETGGTTNAPTTPLPALASVAATKTKAT